MVGVTSQASVQMPKNNGSMAPPLSGLGGPIQTAKQLQSFPIQAKGSAPTQLLKTKGVKKSPPSSDDEPSIPTSLPPRAKMVLKQGPIPKKTRRESELEELLEDAERKKEADKVMLWRKLQAEISKMDNVAN